MLLVEEPEEALVVAGLAEAVEDLLLLLPAKPHPLALPRVAYAAYVAAHAAAVQRLNAAVNVPYAVHAAVNAVRHAAVCFHMAAVVLR